jgi:hypothetical protein
VGSKKVLERQLSESLEEGNGGWRERLRIQRKMREDKGSLVYILLLLLLADGPMDKVDGR